MEGTKAALAPARRYTIRAWPLGVILLAVCIVAAAGTLGSESFERTVASGLVNVILVVGLYVFIGNTGILSFGHMSFMGIGAYVSGLVTISVEKKAILLPNLPSFLADIELPMTVSILLGVSAAAIVAGVVAPPLMRMTGLAAGLATFAILVIVYVVANNWTNVTGGSAGLLGIPTTATLWHIAAWAAVAIAAAFAFQESRVGLRVRAARDDDLAARSIGINITRDRTLTFIVSGAIVAVGGALYAHLQGSFSPNAFYLGLTFTTYVMLVVGGINSLSGAVAGTLVVTALTEGLRRIESGVDLGVVTVDAPPGVVSLGLAVLMMIILIFRPAGLIGATEVYWPWRRDERRRGPEHLPAVLDPGSKS